jgi:soluble lytic murein transglycosylase
MQVRISGARDAARILGIRLDVKRVATDPSYNRTLGQAYANSLLDHYGDVVLATAAYNMGMGNLHRLTHRIGDPRSGRISDAEFVQRMHDGETKNYLLRVVYGETWEQQDQRRQKSQNRRRTPPIIGQRR